ncbi:VRR-NUC domain-containing protein [Aquamicrobium sp. cd-1]|uniref:VRR-NUC domain-containing protein n=2 Tax=Aquamicrobium zhengzhouense TaxID=2781738 RepID=A0ABS0S9X5_9HYPH|nr:VRR-NUC domain-containing protein [Aquamicrobium zhengzhouense]
MMSVREIPGVEKPVVRYALARGWKLGWKLRIDGRNGSPDRWFLRNGVWLVIEFKRPGGKLRPQQVLRIKELRENGQPVHVIDNADVGRALIDSFDQEDLL